MKLDRKKLELEMARACMSTAEITSAAHMPLNTWNGMLRRGTARACTLGKIARALGVDITEIIKED